MGQEMGGRFKRGGDYMYTYGWFILRFDRKQQNSIKQLSFDKKKKKNFCQNPQTNHTIVCVQQNQNLVSFLFQMQVLPIYLCRKPVSVFSLLFHNL